MKKELSFIFDIGRVLVDFDLDIALKRLTNYSAYDYVRIERNIFKLVDGVDIMDEYELGKIDSLSFYKEIKKRAALDMDYDTFVKVWSDIFTENIRISKMLESICDYPKVIVSNINPMHWEAVSKFSNINKYFAENRCIKSYEVGLRKPDAKIYEIARDILPDDVEILYFDDSIEYIKEASKMNIKGVKYDCRVDDIKKILKAIA